MKNDFAIKFNSLEEYYGKEIVNYGEQYRVIEIKDSVFFCKKENGVWRNTAVTISLKELFEFDKEDLLVFVLISYGDYFRLKSNKGRVLEVGWLKDGIVYEEEIEGSEKVDEGSSWLHEDEYYDSEGKLRNLKDLL